LKSGINVTNFIKIGILLTPNPNIVLKYENEVEYEVSQVTDF